MSTAHHLENSKDTGTLSEEAAKLMNSPGFTTSNGIELTTSNC